MPIHILFRKSSQKQWHNMALKGAKNALRWLNDLINEYPFPQLTVCEGVLAGGREYPMVTILGNVDLTLIVHEIGHIYFYSAVANNELDEGWLDEGIITYISEFLVEENGKSQNTKTTASVPIKIHFINKQFGRYEFKDIKLNSLYYYFYSGFEKPISTRCYELKNRYLYTCNVYMKSSKFFAMLDYLVGRETFEKILQAYYQQWQFKHVDGEILKKVCEQVSGIDLDWFFNQWIYKTVRIDYACTDGSYLNRYYVTRNYFWYGIKLHQSNLNFDGQLSNEAWASDFNYVRLSLNYRFTLGSAKRNWKVSFRNYVGYSYQKHGQIPNQDMFWVAEGNPNRRFKYFYLRSIGSLPTWLNYHFPGDGNLRGYFNKLIRGSSPFTANKLITTNIDFVHRKAHYFLPKKLRGLLQGINFTLFFDAGRVWIDGINRHYLFDAGFGLIFYKKILGKHRNLRFDFPLYVNHPELDGFSPSESSWMFRWIVSFQ